MKFECHHNLISIVCVIAVYVWTDLEVLCDCSRHFVENALCAVIT